MKRGAALLIGLALAFPLAAAAPGTRLVPLDKAGYQKLIRSHAGKVLLVDFWATWCEPCREEMPQLVKLAEQYGSRGLRLATVSADTEEALPKAEQFLRSRRVPFPAYYKSARDDDEFINSVSRSWSGALPALFLYDRNGRLAASLTGETDPKDVEAAIRKALGP